MFFITSSNSIIYFDLKFYRLDILDICFFGFYLTLYEITKDQKLKNL